MSGHVFWIPIQSQNRLVVGSIGGTADDCIQMYFITNTEKFPLIISQATDFLYQHLHSSPYKHASIALSFGDLFQKRIKPQASVWVLS